MKIIISHDVDHITVWEHKKDLIIPKHILRSFIEFSIGYSSLSELINRFKSITKNKWQNIDELIDFDKINVIPSTFFVAVKNGRNLNYSLKNAQIWINRIIESGLDLGLHGLAYSNYSAIKEEYTIFKNLSKLNTFGIRIHNIGKRDCDIGLTKENLALMNKAQFLFSSNSFEFINPYKVGDFWDFPIHIMDGYILERNGIFKKQTLEQAKQETVQLVQDACEKGIRFFNILFHDIYFSNNFNKCREWYMWFVCHIKKSGFQFVNYRKAIQELENESNN